MTGRQRLVLVVLLASQFLLASDFSILNVALPDVGRDLDLSAGSLQWVTTVFALCTAGTTLVFGRIGDFVGRRRMFAIGMAVLAVGSLIGGLAQSSTMLLAARALQGLATAALTPAALALLTVAFTEPSQRNRVLGLNGVMLSSGFTVGAIFGGILTDLLSWRWAFFVNIPIAVAALVVVPLTVAESRAENRQRIDAAGAALITSGLFAGIYGLSRLAQDGPDGIVAIALVLAVVLLVVFWQVESRTPDALVPLRVLRLPAVAYSNLGALFIFGGETALIFFTVLYAQNVLGYSSLIAGVILISIGAGQIIAGAYGPKVLERIPAKTVLGAALVGQGLFIVPFIWLEASTTWLITLLVLEFINAVFSMLAMVAFLVIATGSVDSDHQGMATGMATQSQQLGIALGIPLLSAVFSAVIGGSVAASEQLRGIQVALLVDGVLLVVVGCFLIWRLRRVHIR